MTKTYFTKTTDQIDEQGTVLELSVDYRLGTASSWYDGSPRPRGLVFSVTPVRYKKYNGYSSKEFRIGDNRGRTFLVKELKRRSDKQGQQMAEKVSAVFDGLAAAAMAQNWSEVAGLLRENVTD